MEANADDNEILFPGQIYFTNRKIYQNVTRE